MYARVSVEVNRNDLRGEASTELPRLQRALSGLVAGHRYYWAECSQVGNLWVWSPDTGARNKFGADVPSGLKMVFVRHEDHLHVLAIGYGANVVGRALARMKVRV